MAIFFIYFPCLSAGMGYIMVLYLDGAFAGRHSHSFFGDIKMVKSKNIRLLLLNSFVFVIAASFSDLLFAADEYLLGTHQWSSHGGSRQIVTGGTMSLWMNLYPGSVDPVSISWVISNNDIGDTFFSDAESGPGFSRVVDYLTNGQNDSVGIAFLGGGHFISEDTMTDVMGIPQVDFYGYDITRIGLTVNNLTFDTPGSNPNGNGIWTDYSYDVSTSFYGTPEPSSCAFVILGGLYIFRKRQQVRTRDTS